jgi:hypothetical protein
MHERAASMQERFAALQDQHARHARLLNRAEMAVRAEGRARRALERARNERLRASRYPSVGG